MWRKRYIIPGHVQIDTCDMSSFVEHVVFWPHLMSIELRKYLTPYFTAEDARMQFMIPPANYVYGCHVAPVTRGVCGFMYVSHQKGIIQVHPGHRCPRRKDLGLCSRVMFQSVGPFDVSAQTVFLYYMPVKFALGDYFWCLFVSTLSTGSSTSNSNPTSIGLKKT